MNRVSRYWFTALGMTKAALFLACRYRPRKKKLYSVLSRTNLTVTDVSVVESRIRQYIPPFLLIEFLFGLLHNQPLSKAQSHKAMLLNALTPLFDDLTDELHFDEKAIRMLLSDSKAPAGVKPFLCKYLFDEGKFEWNVYWENVVKAQLDSARQLGGKLTSHELLQLTNFKGAASVELGWHVIAGEAGGDSMKNLASGFGAFAQILNDVFDIWKDREAGLQTLATECRDISQLKRVYKNAAQHLSMAIALSKAPNSGKNQVVALLVPIFCLGELAIEKLEKLQTDSGGDFNINNYTRKDLVCDMARWKNRMRWMILVLQNNP